MINGQSDENSWTVGGKISRDPTFGAGNNGKQAYLRVNLQVERVGRDAAVTGTTYVTLMFFGQPAETFKDSLHQGMYILARNVQPRVSIYTKKDETTGYSLEGIYDAYRSSLIVVAQQLDLAVRPMDTNGDPADAEEEEIPIPAPKSRQVTTPPPVPSVKKPVTAPDKPAAPSTSASKYGKPARPVPTPRAEATLFGADDDDLPF